MNTVTSSLVRRGCPSNPGDAPYAKDCGEYTSVVVCPNGIQGKAGGVGECGFKCNRANILELSIWQTVLLVHGTAADGGETWGQGPYMQVLPNHG